MSAFEGDMFPFRAAESLFSARLFQVFPERRVCRVKTTVASARPDEIRQVQIPEKSAYCTVKRLLDILISAIALLILLLPLAVVLIIDAIDLGCSPFFTQNRIGQNGVPFRIYKIRTMRKEAPRYRATGELSDHERYITRFGSVLRKLSIDELPQLFNVLEGKMSIVGPRPLIPEEKKIHDMRSSRGVYALKPGMTGLAQINGRDDVTAEEKVRWDALYLERFGFRQDCGIILRSFKKVILGDGVREGAPRDPKEKA